MKKPNNKISNYQNIPIQTPSQKLRSEANVSCSIYHKKFVRKDYLTKHIHAHIKKIYSCTLCPQKFTHKSDYIRHINAHIPLETRIINAFIKQVNRRVPTHIPTQHFTYMPLESLPFETAIQELEWIK